MYQFLPVAYAAFMYQFLPVAYVATENSENHEVNATSTETRTETVAETKHEGGGLSVQLPVVAFQMLNFIILLLALYKILYGPLIKMLDERSKKIKDGVENAEKAELSLKEAHVIRADMLKSAKAETLALMEGARKSAEEMKNAMVHDAQKESDKIIQNGHQLVAMEKDKTMNELKKNAVHLIVQAAEKVLREKIDSSKDAQMIQESLQSFSS